jgi:hypothetical protein
MTKDEIIQAYLNGDSTYKIGKQIGKGHQMVCYYLKKWGIPLRKPGPIIRGKGFKFRHWIADIQRRYGVSETQYNALCESQGGVCAICKNKCVRDRLGVDHCHTTGKVRGLLCVKCNNAIGLFNDDPNTAYSAYEYLSK